MVTETLEKGGGTLLFSELIMGVLDMSGRGALIAILDMMIHEGLISETYIKVSGSPSKSFKYQLIRRELTHVVADS